MCDVNLGDTIIVEGIVTAIANDYIYYRVGKDANLNAIRPDGIKAIIPKPWEPKVGDVVFRKNYEGWVFRVISIDEDDVFCRIILTPKLSVRFSVGQARILSRGELLCAD